LEGGVKITNEQFQTLAARTVEMARATGQEATPAFERLTNAIRSGSTEAFREYGINLRQSTKLSDTHKNAIKGLTEGYENFSVEAETTNERLFALRNNVGTMTTMLWNSAGSSGTLAAALDGVNTGLAIFNEEMAKSPNAMAKFVDSGYALQGFLAELEIQLLDMIFAIPIAIEKQTLEPSLMSNMFSLLFGTKQPKQVQGKGWLEQKIDDIREDMAQMSRESVEVLERMKSSVLEEPVDSSVKQPRVLEVGMERELFDTDQGFLQEDLAERRQLEEHITELEQARLEREQENYERKRDAELERIQQSTEWQTEYFMFLDELEAQHEQRRMDRLTLGFHADAATIKATEKMWKKSLQSRAQMMGGFFGIIGQLQQSENEKAWRIGKAANIAKTVIDTYTGAIAAYKSMAGIPYIGPALGAAAAAAVTVMGFQAVRNIKQTEFTDQGQPGASSQLSLGQMPSIVKGGGGSGIGAGTSSSSISGVPSGANQNVASLQRQEVTVNVVMKDDGLNLFDVVMEQNDSSDRDGRRSFSTTRAA
jgi:hypothetical protein